MSEPGAAQRMAGYTKTKKKKGWGRCEKTRGDVREERRAAVQWG